ncbi:MAG: TraR/DksA C4-type zinc finger protein [Anaerolineae bacterium]|nr:TraR/DksA C4-type zinc finger protein [Anaerolineae bacterium]
MVIKSLEEFRQLLLKDRTRLMAQLGHETSWNSDSLGYGNHMADDGTEVFEQVVDQSMRARLEDTLQSVEEALKKFDLGTFGTCEGCGEPIDWARLEAQPHATLCIKCKQKRDFRH